ncbi:hypothetical protein [Salinilacihabitans rarus]|uniref:hypothetical protein n=1 Tax=Salinilacihabitans rarus TaxID=2961596 RepID=UPI0020C878B6|nr:hypothetical protein [Salinilacihabitans rarus]
MNAREALKWMVLYRTIATGSFLAGLLSVAAGLVLGLDGGPLAFVADPSAALADADGTVVVAFALLGFVVWQGGKTLALFLTLPRAAGRAAAEEFDVSHLKSDLLQGLDERLTAMEEDVRETRRHVAGPRREGTADGSESPSRQSAGAGGSTATRDDGQSDPLP